MRPYRPTYASKKQKNGKSYRAHLARENQRYEQNKEEIKELRRTYYQQNSEAVKARSKTYREQNGAKRAAWNAERRARRMQATPLWYKDEKEAVERLYAEAQKLTRETGVQYTVDHIVPLTNDSVCGLHCLANLQILTLSENSRKSNNLVNDNVAQ